MAYRPKGGIAARTMGGRGRSLSTSQRLAGVTGFERARAGTHVRMDRGDWTRLKMSIIDERGNQCERCGKPTSQLILNHKVGHAQGGSNMKHNLELLCYDCDNNQIGSNNRRGSRLLHGGRR
ncbi:HNH endonuclease [Dickeya phage vB_DsoM_AD1]|uniref:Putative HNH family endonuclease n=1 Tax=Dickeya phage vB_DsoM_AD1 TaxID=2283029 RepID=A0A384ZYA6_9CAUD|nr:HNH endonuclease [Dickeya phage vB_DsoM_AD1]AXG67222.1 putative HNH family endonuclease [Dickeya phage vB_DsoM_AD1]